MLDDLAGAAESIQKLAKGIYPEPISARAEPQNFREKVEQIVNQVASEVLASSETTLSTKDRGELINRMSQSGEEESLGVSLALALLKEKVELSSQQIRALEESKNSVVTDMQKALRSRQLVGKLFADDLPGCAVVIVKNGEVLDHFGCGVDEPGGKQRSADQRQHFCSVSKQFTAKCILELVKEGKLNLSDDIRKHLPNDFPLPQFYIRDSAGCKQEVTITIDNLLYMESGLPNFFAYIGLAGKKYADLKSSQDCLDLIFPKGQESLILAFKPGDREHAGNKSDYQNINYQLLSEIVENKSGQTLRDYADEKIFNPLGMTNTHFIDQDKDVTEQSIKGYAIDGKEEVTPQHKITGGTGVIGAPLDMVKWYKHLATDKTARELFQPRYGRAVYDETLKKIEKCQKHIQRLEGQREACGKGKGGRSKYTSLGEQIKAYFARLEQLQEEMKKLTTEVEYARGLEVNRRDKWDVVFHDGGDEGFRTKSLYVERVDNPAENFSVFLAANRDVDKGLFELCLKLADTWTGESIFSPGAKALPEVDVPMTEGDWIRLEKGQVSSEEELKAFTDKEEKALAEEEEKTLALLPAAIREAFEHFTGAYHCPVLGASYEIGVSGIDEQSAKLEMKIIKDGKVFEGPDFDLVPDDKNPNRLCGVSNPEVDFRLGEKGEIIFSDSSMSIAELVFIKSTDA